MGLGPVRTETQQTSGGLGNPSSTAESTAINERGVADGFSLVSNPS